MEADDFDFFNPHEDAEPFLRDILRHAHGRLAPSLHLLVTLLRDTLPIVVELEAIRKEGRQHGRRFDIFAKAAGWYRLLYGDFKCVFLPPFPRAATLWRSRFPKTLTDVAR